MPKKNKKGANSQHASAQAVGPASSPEATTVAAVLAKIRHGDFSGAVAAGAKLATAEHLSKEDRKKGEYNSLDSCWSNELTMRFVAAMVTATASKYLAVQLSTSSYADTMHEMEQHEADMFFFEK